MVSEIVSLISGLGLGSLLGAFAKSVLDKRQLRYSKVFDYKEIRYKTMTLLMLAATDQSGYAWTHVLAQRPRNYRTEDLDRELNDEYYNAMIFASDEVLKNLARFLENKTLANYRNVAYAIRRDLYL